MEQKEIIDSVIEHSIDKMPKTINAVDSALSTIVDIFNVLLSPFKALKVYSDVKLDTFRKNLERKASKIPNDELKISPELNIVGPAIESLKFYLLEDDLREMFENLLVSTIDKRKIVFPGFVDIIKQLNSDEAKLLKLFALNSNNYPIVDLRYEIDNGNSFTIVLSNFTDVGYGIIEKNELMSSYLVDLNRLGLIEIKNGWALKDKELYKSIEEHELIKKAKETKMSEIGTFKIQRNSFAITDYGKRFLDSCVKSN